MRGFVPFVNTCIDQPPVAQDETQFDLLDPGRHGSRMIIGYLIFPVPIRR